MTICSITDCHHSTPKWTLSGKIVIRNFNIKKGKLNLNDLSFTNDETYNERIKRKKPEAGDLIITREAPMGEVCIIPEGLECCLGQRMVLLKPNKKNITGKYLLYALQSEFVQIQILKSDKTGSIVSNLRIPALEELNIPVFDFISENKIGSLLNDIDSKIELNNRINAELEAMAKTLYDYWFVQFDFPDKNDKPYKTSGGNMVWNEELKREIPEGWEVKFLRNEIEIQRGISYTSKEINGDGIPMINLNSFNLDGTYKSEGVKTYSGKFLEKNIVKSGDLLIAATDVTRNADIIGKAILVPDYYKGDLVFSMDIAKIIY
jgi:type I restriction enzyme S subunit